MDRGRAHSPIPPPREPKRTMPGYDREPDRRPPPPMRGRRPRSISPPRRSPPRDSYKRRRDDYDYDRQYGQRGSAQSDRYGSPRRRGHSPDYGRGYDAGYDDFYHQPPPPPKRGEERPSGPKTFKQFMLEDVPDGVSPTHAKDLYDAYLTRHFGDQLRAKFETDKGQPEVRSAYHPAAFESSLARHKEDAASAAAVLALEIRDGKYDPSSPTFDQGQLKPEAGEGEEGAGGAVAAPAGPAPEGPVGLWKPERVAHDYKVARRLVCVVDQQRGLQVADNPLLPNPPPPAAAAAEGADGEAVKDDPEAGEGAEGAAGAGAAPEASFKAALAEIEAEEVVVDDEAAFLERLGQLDLLLTWLWAVHGIDYYGGRELLLESEYAARSGQPRTIRGARPEEGEEQDEEEAKVDAAKLAAQVDSRWSERLEQPDPLLQGCQKEEIEKRLNEYVESQIKKESDKKWGSSFSNKYFLEKRFVVKHIFNKHQQRLDEQRDVIRDELYWLAYEAAKKSQHAAARATEKQREKEAAAAAAAAAAGDVHMAEEGYEGDEGYVAAPAAGRGPGRLGPMRGRGSRGGAGAGGLLGGRAGRGLGGLAVAAGAEAAGLLGALPVVDPSMMMMGGLPGPILLPPGGIMGGLPGALPMGAPLIIDPSMMGAADMSGGMPMFLPAGGAMARGGMRGGGMMSRGGRGGVRGRGLGGRPEGPGYLKNYYDLDAPANNRAVLDYGDL